MNTNQKEAIRENLPYGFIVSDDCKKVVFFNREYQPIKILGQEILNTGKETIDKMRKNWKNKIHKDRYLLLDAKEYPATYDEDYKGRRIDGEMWFFYSGIERPYLTTRTHLIFLLGLSSLFEAFAPDVTLTEHYAL